MEAQEDEVLWLTIWYKFSIYFVYKCVILIKQQCVQNYVNKKNRPSAFKSLRSISFDFFKEISKPKFLSSSSFCYRNNRSVMTQLLLPVHFSLLPPKHLSTYTYTHLHSDMSFLQHKT